MAGRIASATVRAVVGTRKPIKAALTLVCQYQLGIIFSLNKH